MRLFLKLKSFFIRNYKFFLIALFILIILLPNINMILGIIENIKLSGVTIDEKRPEYSLNNYYSGEYQSQFDKWYLQNYASRNIYIKMYNQLRYDLFSEGSVVVGKYDYLFEKGYINEYLGIGIESETEDEIQQYIQLLESINNICNSNGKKMYLIITPSKADFETDYIPNKYFKMVNNDDYIRAYDLLKDKIKDTDINYFDSVDYLKNNKIDAPIFYKTGTHWSFVASTYVLKDFINKINETSSLSLKTIQIESIEKNTKPFFKQDTDIYDVLNIWNGTKDNEYYKPKVKYIGENNNKNLFICGGSFMWNLTPYLYKNIFKNVDAMFYTREIRHYNEKEKGAAEKIQNNNPTKEQLDKSLQNKDIIIIEVNQQAIKNSKFGFVKKLENYLKENGFPD